MPWPLPTRKLCHHARTAPPSGRAKCPSPHEKGSSSPHQDQALFGVSALPGNRALVSLKCRALSEPNQGSRLSAIGVAADEKTSGAARTRDGGRYWRQDPRRGRGRRELAARVGRTPLICSMVSAEGKQPSERTGG